MHRNTYVYYQMFAGDPFFFITELPKIFQNFTYFIEFIIYILIFVSILSQRNTIWANLRQVLQIENQYSFIDLSNTSFYIYYRVPTYSNGQELIENGALTLMLCDAMCDILSQVTGNVGLPTPSYRTICDNLSAQAQAISGNQQTSSSRLSTAPAHLKSKNGFHQVRNIFLRGKRMIRSEHVGWIAVVEVGWHGTTLDNVLPI